MDTQPISRSLLIEDRELVWLRKMARLAVDNLIIVTTAEDEEWLSHIEV